jgi:hypothetical protein
MTKETGGPAFSHHVVCVDRWSETQKIQGISVRDYFAAKAMQALIASPHCPYEFDATEKSETAYTIADAMLKAREE